MRAYEIVPISVAPGEWVRLRLPSRMTPLEWHRFMAILAAMRPALTYDPVPCALGPGYREAELC